MAKTTSIARRFAMLAILAAVSLLGYEYWANEVVWPEFSTNQASAQAPQAVLKIERDYGWRTGDALPVEVYIKETPGTRVDLAAITMQNQAGDFEVRDALSPVRTKIDDSGAHLIKAKFSVQSLNYGGDSFTLFDASLPRARHRRDQHYPGSSACRSYV